MIPPVEIPANPDPFLIVPEAAAVMPDGTLIVDYIARGFDETSPVARIHLDTNGVAIADSLPFGPLAVQPDGSMLIAPSSAYRRSGRPLLRFIPDANAKGSKPLYQDENHWKNMYLAAPGQRCLGLAAGNEGKIWAWLIDDAPGTNSLPKLTRFLRDGRRDPGFAASIVSGTTNPGYWEPWIGSSPDGGAFALLPGSLPPDEIREATIVKLRANGDPENSTYYSTVSQPRCGGIPTRLTNILTPLPDGGLLVPDGCDFVRLRADGTADEAWNSKRATATSHLGFVGFGQAVREVDVEPDGSFLVRFTFVSEASRLGQPFMVRLRADGSLSESLFDPSSPFARATARLSAQGMVPGKSYVLERSETLDPGPANNSIWSFIAVLQAPPSNLQPLQISLLPRWDYYSGPSPVSYWRLTESGE